MPGKMYTAAAECVIRGDAGDESSVGETEKTLPIFPSDTANGYEVETKLFFDERATRNAYIVSGFSSNEWSYPWTDGNEAVLRLPIKKVPQTDLLLSLMLKESCFPPQRVDVYLNDKLLNYYLISGNALHCRTLRFAVIPIPGFWDSSAIDWYCARQHRPMRKQK